MTDKNIEVHLRGINKKHYDEMNLLRKQRKYTWSEFFKHLYTYRTKVVNLLNRGSEPDLCMIKSAQTVTALLPKWCDNISHNMSDIINSGDIADLICTTRKDNKCWKIAKLKEMCTDPDKEYEKEEISEECQIPTQELDMYIKHAYTYQHVGCAGSNICSSCSNYIRHNKPALIIGGGPSLKTYNHLELLKEHGFDGDIFVVGKELKNVLEHGIIPQFVGALDAEEFDTSFFDHEIVDENADKITAFFGVNIHPTTTKRWKGKRYYFSGYLSEADMPNISHTIHLLTHTSQLSVSGNIGSCLYNIASFLGYNPIVTIGLDLSFPTLQSLKDYYPNATDEDWKRKTQIGNKLIKQYYRRNNPIYNKQYYVDSVYESYAIAHKSWADTLSIYYNIKSINCSEQGSLYSDSILNIPFKEYLENKDKYNKVDIIDYTKMSLTYTQKDCHDVWKQLVNSHESLSNPEIYVTKPKDIIELMNSFWSPDVTPNMSVFELGCNCGVNLNWLSTYGFSNFGGIDINKNAINKMKEYYTKLYKTGNFHIGSIEDKLHNISTKEYDVVFSMATLQHIHHTSNETFPEIVRIAKKYILTLENESMNYGYMFARNYKDILEPLGCKEIKNLQITKATHPNLNRNYHGYTMRLFKVL